MLGFLDTDSAMAISRGPLTPLDIQLLVAGLALTSGMLLLLIRRTVWPVTMDAQALHVGPQSLPWSTIERLAFGRNWKGGWIRVFTADGELTLRDEQLDLETETAAQRIATRAGLSLPQGPEAHALRNSGDAWREWARPPGAAAALVASAGTPAVHAEAAESRSLRTRLLGGRRTTHPDTSRTKGAAASIGALLLMLVKFGKAAAALLGSGIKVLNVGQILPTAMTMLATVWAYAVLWGWWFATGFVGLILVHELGHAAVMRAKGLRTSPIVFVPFVGAFIAIKGQFRDATVEAETAYGGPAAGALAALACLLVHQLTGNPFWLHLAYVGCVLNLFNLLPVAPLDGGRIVAGISVWLWILGLPAGLALALWSGHPILFLIVILGSLRAWEEWKLRRDPAQSQRIALPIGYRVRMATAYFGLIALLSYFTLRTLMLGGATR